MKVLLGRTLSRKRFMTSRRKLNPVGKWFVNYTENFWIWPRLLEIWDMVFWIMESLLIKAILF